MRIKAVVYRIFRQFIRDKRTLALLIIAPIFIFTLVNYVLLERDVVLNIGTNSDVVETIFKDDLLSFEKVAKSDINNLFKEDKIDAYIEINNKDINIMIEGSSPSKSSQLVKRLDSIMKAKQPVNAKPQFNLSISSFYGDDEMSQFDYLSPIFISFFVFFFVFLISGVSFLRERTTGTLERLLATPIKRREIVIGYTIGFGLFTIVQTAIILAFSIYVLGTYSVGAFWLIILVSVFNAVCALTFGLFISAYANNEFQMIQFIPIIIVPQAFFTGLFPIEGMAEPLQWLGKIMPLTYSADALQQVMIKGVDLSYIWGDLVILTIFIIVFAVLNVITLKKYRIW